MEPSKSMARKFSMMERHGTKSPGSEHGKPGKMEPWYTNLLIYELVRTALNTNYVVVCDIHTQHDC